MKVKITMKSPDCVGEAIDEAVRDSVQALGITDPEEFEAVYDTRREKVGKQLGTWIEYSEYVTVEFDLDTMTATVVPVN